jgi:hypothetical protein
MGPRYHSTMDSNQNQAGGPPPESVAAVKQGQNQAPPPAVKGPPRGIALLESKVSRLEARQGALESALDGLTKGLADMLPAPSKARQDAGEAQKRGFLAGLASTFDDIL